MIPQRTLTTHSDTDKILFHLQGKEGYETISKTLQEKLERIRVIRDWYDKYKVTVKVVPMVMKEFNVSESQARRLCDDCIEIYNVMHDLKGRNFKIELLENAFWKTYEKALAADDWKAATSCLKELRLIYLEFYGDEDAKKYKELQPPSIVIGNFLSQLNVKIPDDIEEQIRRLKEQKQNRHITIPIERRSEGSETE